MVLTVGTAASLTLIQLIGAYLRYLPFSARLLPEECGRLRRYILFWAPVAFTIYVAYFYHEGCDVITFKRVQYVGWIPFFAFSLVVIRHGVMRHVFVLGMQTLWLFMLHTISSVLILMLLPPTLGAGDNRILSQPIVYICCFLLLLPLERKFFRNLLPPYLFTGSRWAGWSFALLPLGICITPFFLLLDKPLMNTTTDMMLHLIRFLWGLILYKYTLYAGERAAQIQSGQHTNELLSQQLQALESHAAMLQSRAEDVQRARHDLRHYNRLLASLLDAGEVEKARALVETQDRELLAQPIDAYCESPILNAALTVYMQLAKKDGVRTSCEVDIEAGAPRSGDNDLAILLSNVIENAGIASRKQPVGEREIRVSLACTGREYALVVENRYDEPVVFGDDGLPTTAEHGHGTGMISLRNFSQKYGAEVIFEQRDGWVRLLMYWNGQEKEKQGSEA